MKKVIEDFFIAIFVGMIIMILSSCNYVKNDKSISQESSKDSFSFVLREKLKILGEISPISSGIYIIKFTEYHGKELVTISNLKCLNKNEQYSGYLLMDGNTIVIQDTSKFGSQYYDNTKLERKIPDNYWCSNYNFDSTFSLLYIKFDSVFYRYGASTNFLKLNIQINDSTENPDFLF